MKTIFLSLIFCIACNQASITRQVSDREHDGFIGPVKKVFVEWSPIHMSHGSIPLGSRCRQMTNTYDENGRVIQHSVYPGSCGRDEIREEYSYTHNGSQTSRTREIRGKDSPPPPPPVAGSDAEGERGQSRKIFKYDSSGKRAEVASVKPGGKIAYKYTYTYDVKGRLIETTGYDGEGRVTDRRVFSYSGNEPVPAGFTYYGRDSKVYERTVYSDYEFNSRGDWIKRKETTEEWFSKSISWTFREIEYYSTGK